MKIIFLDCDGVLNDIHTKTKHICEGEVYDGVDKKKIELLKKLIDATGAKIVLSSTWRKYRESTEYLIQEMGPELASNIVGQTEDFALRCRADEINDWLERHTDVTKFVVLDDNCNEELFTFGSSWVRTWMSHGFTEEEYQKCLKILEN